MLQTSRWLALSTCALALFSLPVGAEEPTPSERAIADAIKLLEERRDKIEDGIEQAKVDKAIRELEVLIEDPNGESMPEAKAVPLDFEVTPAMLKKKFSGKAVFNPKSGELTLTYDFPGKAQLADFEVNDAKVMVAKKALMIDAGDNLKHIARFKSFTASATLAFKSMRGAGISSTSGAQLVVGGPKANSVVLRVAGGPADMKVVPQQLRAGAVPVSLMVTSGKTAIRFGPDKMSLPNVRKDDIHQVVLNGGTEGCGIANLTIVGIPDAAWLKEFLEAE